MMDDSELDKILGLGKRIHFKNEQGIEFTVYGDETRKELAKNVLYGLPDISYEAVKLLRSFMSCTGRFDLDCVEIFEMKDHDGADFFLDYHFESDHFVNDFRYTDFKVF